MSELPNSGQEVKPPYPKFPREPNGEGGWTISTAYLKAISDHVAAQPDPWPSGWEEIQDVLLAVEALADKGVPS
jgi:hypothetical protein